MDGPLHGTMVAHAGSGILLLGPSGSGKSRLAAEMMLHGARLVADDRVDLTLLDGMLMAGAPPQLSGVLELRHLGLIRVIDCLPRHVLHVAVELTEEPVTRLPEPQRRMFLGVAVPLLRLPPPPATSAAAILHYVRALLEGRVLPTDWRPASTTGI